MADFPTTVRPSYPIIKSPMFETIIVSYGNQVEQRIQRNSAVRYKFTLDFTNKTHKDIDTILAFFIARKGKYESFTWQNPQEAYTNDSDLKWKANTVYILNNIVRPNNSNGRSYRCTVAGTSHASTEPTWPTTANGTVVDNTVTWTENTYTVRFDVDLTDMEYFTTRLVRVGKIDLIQVAS